MTNDLKDSTWSSVLIIEKRYSKGLWRTIHITTKQSEDQTIVSVNLKASSSIGEKSAIVELSTDEALEFASLLRAAATHDDKDK
jgi:hypothetical protein